MKTTIKSLFTFLLASIVFISCSKDDDNKGSSGPTVSKSTATLLVGDWLTTALTVDPPIEDNGKLVTDYFAQLEPCTQDDIVSFNSDSSFIYAEGPTKCDSLDQQIIDFGTYALDSNDTYVVLTSGSDINYLKIVSISSTMLRVSFTETDMGVEYTFTQTLDKQ